VTDDDERLKRGFTKLREADARRAPAFEALVRAGKPRRRSPWAVVVPITSAVAAAAVLVLWCSTQQLASESAPVAAAPAHAPAAASAAAQIVDQKAAPAPPDSAPLDFLLEMPGTSALAAMPTFDDALIHGRSR
jgi:hypothetical protein